MDRVAVTIPSSPQYLQVVRLVAAGVASRLKFTLDDIEDLKIAVDELCAYLTGAQGRDGTLHITFTVHDDLIEIEGTGEFTPGDKIRTDLTDFSKVILETVVDSASLEKTDGVPVFKLAKRKRSA